MSDEAKRPSEETSKDLSKEVVLEEAKQVAPIRGPGWLSKEEPPTTDRKSSPKVRGPGW